MTNCSVEGIATSSDEKHDSSIDADSFSVTDESSSWNYGNLSATYFDFSGDYSNL